MNDRQRLAPALLCYTACLWLAAGATVVAPALFQHAAREYAEGPWVIGTLILCVGLAGVFPLALTPKVKINTATTPLFAAALLFPAPLAAGVAAAGTVLAHGVLLTRGRRRGFDALFNTGRTILQVAVAAVLFRFLGGALPVAAAAVPTVVGAVLAAGFAYYVINVGVVFSAASIILRQDPVALWRATVRIEAPQQAALLLFGIVVALLADSAPLLAAAMVLPIAVVYYSLRTTLALRAETKSALEALADAVDARVEGSYGHSVRVATLAGMLAERLGMASENIALVRQAARVHDIGKVEVADSILLKPGPLLAEERVVMEQHVEHALRLLARFPEFERCRPLVRAHHERPDGTGYPERLHDVQIPLGAAIIAVAEAYDAMTSRRPYREALSPASACAELSDGAGRVWSGVVVRALLQEVARQDVAARRSQVPASVALRG